MKWVLITGATGTIGSAICKILSEKNFYLILGGRDEMKLNQLKQNLEKQYKNSCLIFLADLRSKHSIQQAINNLFSKNSIKLYALVNNASETPKRKIITEEGLECQFAVNILGYHRMIAYLKEYFENGARIVNVSSYWAGDLDLADLQFEKRSYHNHIAYRQSKQAERMLTVIWSEILREKNILVNACHPGDANSKLSNDLGFGGFESPMDAANTPAYLVYSEEIKSITGKYFEHRKIVSEPFAKNMDQIKKLFEICNKYL